MHYFGALIFLNKASNLATTGIMTADEYLQRILARERVDTGPLSLVRGVQTKVGPIIREWAGSQLISINPSGSFAKGTANRRGTDIDLFISLSPQTSETLKEVYDKLFARMKDRGYSPKHQNVSVSVRVDGYDVDLVPAKRQDAYSDDHSLYRRRADTWTKTNVIRHINHVVLSGRVNEIRLIKLWRDQKGLDFPSFYLELSVIAALSGQYGGTLSANVWSVFEYLADSFFSRSIIDPANSNNIVSDDLSAVGKLNIKNSAAQARKAKMWDEIIT